MKIFEAYFSVLCALILLFVIPIVLYNERMAHVKEEFLQYNTDVIAWQVETTHEIPTSRFAGENRNVLVNLPYTMSYIAYNEHWATMEQIIPEKPDDPSELIEPIDLTDCKYVYLELQSKDAKKGRWIILD